MTDSNVCELCREPITEEFGCQCDELMMRVKKVRKAISNMKEQCVAQQNFHAASKLRDAMDNCTWALYAIKHTIEEED